VNRILALLLAGAAVSPGGATAADPGLWVKTSRLTQPSDYRQGMASDPQTGDVFFSGSFAGITRTRGGAKVLGANTRAIPKDVADREQYNHIGDIAFDSAEGGRLLLPLESYAPFAQDTNPSKTGSVGVMDPKTLHWEYYVKLDPSEIAKAQIFATDPQGLLWTIAGSDLLAYNLADVSPANAAPDGAPIHSVKRLAGVAPGGAGGIAVHGGRIYLSTQAGKIERIVSVDSITGASRTEVEQTGDLEPEGLDFGPYLGGYLHWGLVPGGGLSNTQLLNLVPKGARLSLKLVHARVKSGRIVGVTGQARVLTNGVAIPLAGVQLSVAGRSAKTNAAGRATVKLKLTRGSYRAQAFYPGLRSATKKLRAI
jgi:hypothetical protein